MKKIDLSRLKNIKLKKIKFKRFKVTNLKSKILKTMILLVIFAVIGVCVYLYKKNENTAEYATKRYQNEISDLIDIGKENSIIKIVKEDLNDDGVDEYICLYGKVIYSSSTSSVDISKNIVMYQNVSLIFVDGATKEVVKYESTKSFYNNINLSIKESDGKKYIFVNSMDCDSVVLIRKQDNTIIDVIKDSFGDSLTGYTISYKNMGEDEKQKVTMKLDNNATSYLGLKVDDYTLDFTDKNVDLNNYRHSYLKNKYSNFSLGNLDEDSSLEFVGIQNVLYLNNGNKDETLAKTLGKIKVIFDLQDDKLTFKDVNVEI